MNAFYEYLDGVEYVFVFLLVMAYIGFMLATTAWRFFKSNTKKHPLKECAVCDTRASNFLVPSLYGGNKKICPNCADKEWENRPRSA